MIRGVATRTIVVPDDSSVDVRSTANIVAIGIAIASQDVDESGSDTSHAEIHGILRAKPNCQGILRKSPTSPQGTQMLRI